MLLAQHPSFITLVVEIFISFSYLSQQYNVQLQEG